MRARFFLIQWLCFLLGLMACASPVIENTKTADMVFEQFLTDEWDYVMTEFPVFASSLGYPGQDHRWSDNSLEAFKRREQRDDSVLERLESIDSSELSAANQLNYTLFKNATERRIEGRQFDGEYLQINQMGGVYSALAQLSSWVPTRTVADYDNLLARMRGVPEQVENTLVFLRIGVEKKVTPPRQLLEKVPELIQAQLVTENHPAMKPFIDMPDSIAKDEQARIRLQAQKILREQVIPSYQQLYDYVVTTYIPHSRTSISLGDLPNGKAWYAFMVKESTTTDLTPEQIHQLGLQEVDRLHREIKKIMDELGFKGDLQAFFQHMKTDPTFQFNNREELLSAYRAIAKRADYRLMDVVSTLPRLPYGVEPVPAFKEKTAPTAYFRRGSLKAGKPGVFFVNTYKPATRYRWELEPLTLHEAVPGHHLQSALAAEQGELPNFRKHGFYTAYIEGWGLYAETLGYEMGFYQTPESRYGQLSYELWRAARLVVDTGIHYYGWTRAEAIEYFVANGGRSSHDSEVEVDRYIVWPAQALAYKVGQLTFKKLRHYCRSKQGDVFDVRDYHDFVLGLGALPLNMLEQKVRQHCTAKEL